MREEFLHYLWRLARFDLRGLQTTEGEPLTIHQFGVLNGDAGPDFTDARLRIGDLQWAGQVEMHLRSSEWTAHGHSSDPAYDSVILHVVLEEDEVIYRSDGTRIPCLELHERIPAGIRNRYWRLLHNEYWVPCETQLAQVGDPVRALWLQRVLAERLSRKAADYTAGWERVGRDHESAFYRLLARAMGGRVNGEAMDVLTTSLPLRIILKHKHSLLQLEALFFGQSGLLPEPTEQEDGYVTRLRREYSLLRVKYDLAPLPVTVWRFLRMRPSNFPTVRIAQLACLYYRSGQLFGKVLAAADARELQAMFVVGLSNYWQTHYRFGAEVERRPRRMGEQMVRTILINAVAPALFAYGRLRQDERYRERAIDLLDQLPAEQNTVTRNWRKLGWEARNAGESQALIELRNGYCTPSRCTSCSVGCAILNQEPEAGAPRLTLNEAARAYALTA